MNPEVILGAAKPLIPIFGGIIAHWGFGTDAQNSAALSLALSAVMGIWAAYSSTQTAKIASINSADNGVKVVASNAPAQQVNTPLK